MPRVPALDNTPTTLIRTYRYGAEAPLQGLEEAYRQHWLKHRYWNALVKWEQHRRWQVSTFLDAHEQLGVTRKELATQHKTQLNAFGANRTTFVRQQRQAAVREGLYFPGYMDVERAWNRARMHSWEPRTKGYDPHQGSLSYPCTNGLEVSELYGANNFVQLEPVSSDTYTSRKARRSNQRTVLRLRIGSHQRNPVWLELPVFLHRPLPKGCSVRGVRVVWQQVGTVTRWHVCITVREAAPTPQLDLQNRVVVALDGHLTASGLQVCCWQDQSGKLENLQLEKTFLTRWSKVTALQSIRDHNRNRLASVLDDFLGKTEGSPVWLLRDTKYFQRWRAQSRFHELLETWRHDRWRGDELVFGLLEIWSKRDRRLCEWQANLRDKLLAERREYYRMLAARLAETYDILVLPDPKTPVIDNDTLTATSDYLLDFKQLLAHSLLRSCLQHAFARRGKRYLTAESSALELTGIPHGLRNHRGSVDRHPTV